MKFKVNNPKYWSAIARKASPWNAKPEMDITLPMDISLGNELAPMNTDTTIKLKPLQQPVFDAVKSKKTALVYAKTSFGKSVVLTALHEAWGGKTLVLSHNLENVGYLHDQFRKFLGIDTGMICTGKNTMKDVTVTTFSSFRSKRKEFEKYGFDNLIVDECDVAFTDKLREAITKFPKKRLLGLTGTIQTVYDIVRVYHDVDKPALKKFYQYTYEAEYDMEADPLEDIFVRKHKKQYLTGPHEWHKFREELDTDIDRKKAMLEYIQETSDHSKEHILVVFDRVSDVEVFYKSAKNRNLKCFMSYGSQNKKERIEHMEEFRKSGGIIFSQYKTIGRGWDVPPLSKVYILFPLKSNVNVEQIIGRVRRDYPDKKSYVYLWEDSSLSYQFRTSDKWKNQFRVEETIKREFNKTIKEI